MDSMISSVDILVDSAMQTPQARTSYALDFDRPVRRDATSAPRVRDRVCPGDRAVSGDRTPWGIGIATRIPSPGKPTAYSFKVDGSDMAGVAVHVTDPFTAEGMGDRLGSPSWSPPV